MQEKSHCFKKNSFQKFGEGTKMLIAANTAMLPVFESRSYQKAIPILPFVKPCKTTVSIFINLTPKQSLETLEAKKFH